MDIININKSNNWIDKLKLKNNEVEYEIIDANARSALETIQTNIIDELAHSHSEYLTSNALLLPNNYEANTLESNEGPQASDTLYSAIAKLDGTIKNNELIIATSLNDLNTDKADISDLAHSHDLSHSHTGYLTSLSHSHSQYAITESLAHSHDLSHSHSTYISGGATVVSVSADLTNQTCPVTLADGEQRTVLYVNSGSTDYTVDISTSSSYVTPDGNAISLTVPNNGYAEVNFLKVGSTIYVRGV